MISIKGLILLAGAVLTANLACATANDANTTGPNQNRAATSRTPVAAASATPRANGITREEFEKDKDRYLREAKAAGRKIGNGAEDAWLWTKTRAALATADDLRDSTINVDADDNIVTLSGTVATWLSPGRSCLGWLAR